MVIHYNNTIFYAFALGAHSHIRGLGLDDALEARQVLYNYICMPHIYLSFIIQVCTFVNNVVETNDIISRRFGDLMTPLSRVQMKIN